MAETQMEIRLVVTFNRATERMEEERLTKERLRLWAESSGYKVAGISLVDEEKGAWPRD